MTLRTKISLSLVFLFSIILMLGGLGAFYLNQLAEDSRAILKDNYISLEFVSTMQKALTTLDDPDALADFESSLKKQEANLTEVGESQATRAVRREFTRLRAGATDLATINRIRMHLFAIDDVNRQAIVRKSKTAEQTAKDALLWLGSIGTFCFLIVFSFVINIPSYIAGPLRELTRGIKQIASRNFEERLHFSSSDEFGELARSFNSMAQKLDEYEHSNLARVLFEKKRIDTLVEIMSEGIIGLDEKRRILFINPVAERLLGVERNRLIGQYAPDIATSNDLLRALIQDIMPDSAALHAQPASDLLRSETGGDLLKIYDPGLNGKGKESYFTKEIHAVEVTPTGETQTVQAGYVIMLLNITSYKELDLAKTNFIATVSHELKTPISAIKMSLKLLADKRLGTLNSEQQEMVNHVEENTDRLLRLTGELLNMAQVESGQIQLQIQATNPAELVRVATSALRTQAEQKQIRFALNLPADLPAVKADSDKASWVLINFLSNAIRHSPEQASIDITARQLGDQIEFTVRDYGPGLRDEHRDRVFERYFKAPGLNGPFSGTGLGLAISKEFIQSMGGQIGLHAEVSPGAAFYFRLAIA
ncbi:HAMP domain-containing protein [Spirosoma sp. KCTC 42546]|uniref:sensor histidine kinase n=1 Tax=Spirosoma sp. KCTC 42546 TaxID=2520506 RepID=UPI001158AABA|nr:ATP-binding protein [Spirosoma sp. KCTC 42546]QDK81945.1 HAMP domain-containing protein [Spirosoma sp. KCTC 42546]